MSGNLRDAGTTSMFAAAARKRQLREHFGDRCFFREDAAPVCGTTPAAMRTWLSKYSGLLVERLGGGLYRVRA